MRSLLATLFVAAVSADQLLYVVDVVNHGSALPANFLNATGVQYPTTGPGELTPFGMRQMNMRGREIRRRYITNQGYLQGLANAKEYQAYAIDTDRTYRSAMSFMTGLYPGSATVPDLLTQD